MNEKSKISRKNFIKNCSATLGLLTVGISSDVFSKSTNNTNAFYKGALQNVSTSQKRGSWVQLGNVQPEDISLENCVLTVAENEHSAVKQAIKFLATDIFKISGYQAQTVTTEKENSIQIIATTLGNRKLPKGINISQLKEKKEAFLIYTAKDTIWLIGADFRGTAYAVYTLSERLGVDPLYHWTGYQPIKNSKLVMKKTLHFEDEPTVKYRGFFHDDEDVLPRPFDRYGYPLRIGDVAIEWYERFFETALRLRMNMVAPYVRVRRRYEVQKCASDWGLYYTSHHYDILLSNPFGIERFELARKRGVNTAWDWFNGKDQMINYWRGGVTENADINAIWPVGLRGIDDHAYKFPEGTSEKEQAKVFKDAIEIQVKTVKELSKSNEQPIFHFTLYTEMLDKYKKHPEDFKVPEDVILVWPDDNDGVMRALPTSKDKWKHGVYYHLAYFGGAPTKQGTHVIAPSRIANEFKKIVDSGATEYMLVNVSEMREHVMEARMIADICWNANEVLSKENPAENYLKWWIAEYFGNENIKAIHQAYHNYYNLINSSEKTYFAAIQFELILDQLHRRFTNKNPRKLDVEKINELKQRNKNYHIALAQITEINFKLNREQKQFLYEHIEFGLRIDQRPTEAAILLLKALNEPNNTKAWDLIAEAAIPLEKLEIEILRAERPPFEKWYIPTWARHVVTPLNVHRSYTQLREFITTQGVESPIKTKTAIGHNLEGAKLWNHLLEEGAKINATY